MKVEVKKLGREYKVEFSYGVQGFSLDYMASKKECEWMASMLKKALFKYKSDLLTEKKYEGAKTSGDIAKEVQVAVGEIGCPHCGTVAHGALSSTKCGWCDKDYFKK